METDVVKTRKDRLTKREIEIFLLIAEGTKNSKIAKKLFISTHTVEIHKANMLKKLNLESASELFCYAAIHKGKLQLLEKKRELPLASELKKESGLMD